MNTSDTPGLWDIQLSSWDFCESNAKVMSLIKSASFWFYGITRTTRRLIRQQTSGHHALVTSGDSGRLPVAIHALVTKLQATHATGLARTQSLSDHWQTDSDFHYHWVVSHTRKHDWTHTHTHSVTAVTLNAASTSGIRLLHGPAFQRLTLILPRPLKASCFSELTRLYSSYDSVTNNSGVSWI